MLRARTENVRTTYGSRMAAYKFVQFVRHSQTSFANLYGCRTNSYGCRTNSLSAHLQFCKARMTVVRRSNEHRTADVRSLKIVLRRCHLPAIGLRFRSHEYARKNISHGWCNQGLKDCMYNKTIIN